MQASNKYDYHPFSMPTMLYSLQIMWRALLKSPEVILLMGVAGYFDSDLFFAPILVIYSLIKGGFLKESLKEDWTTLKRTSLIFGSFAIILTAILTVLFSFIEPNTTPAGNEAAPSALLSSLAVFLDLMITALIAFYMSTLAGEVYDKHRGEGATFMAIVRDKGMLLFLIAVSAITVLLHQIVPSRADNPELFVAVNTVWFFSYFVIFSHIYTPDIPKKTVTKTVLQN